MKQNHHTSLHGASNIPEEFSTAPRVRKIYVSWGDTLSFMTDTNFGDNFLPKEKEDM